MSCRHNLAHGTCITCYPGNPYNRMTRAHPGPEAAPNPDAPGVVLYNEALNRFGVDHDLADVDLDLLLNNVAGDTGFVRPLIREIKRRRAAERSGVDETPDPRPSIAKLKELVEHSRDSGHSLLTIRDAAPALLEIVEAALAWATAEIDSQVERRAAGRLHGLATSMVRP